MKMGELPVRTEWADPAHLPLCPFLHLLLHSLVGQFVIGKDPCGAKSVQPDHQFVYIWPISDEVDGVHTQGSGDLDDSLA